MCSYTEIDVKTSYEKKDVKLKSKHPNPLSSSFSVCVFFEQMEFLAMSATIEFKHLPPNVLLNTSHFHTP